MAANVVQAADDKQQPKPMLDKVVGLLEVLGNCRLRRGLRGGADRAADRDGATAA